MKKKLLIAIPVLLLAVGGYVAKTILMPAPKPIPPKVAGKLVTLTPEFLVNLEGGHYGKLTVALQMTAAPAAAASGDVTLPEDAVVRAQITDALTGLTDADLISPSSRHQVLEKILAGLKKNTDEPVTNVLFTDLVVQ